MAIKVNDKVVAGRGKDGKPGKSAYDYAVDGGYTGTEAEFQSLIAQAQNLDGGPFLPLSGGMMLGDINLNRKNISEVKKIKFYSDPFTYGTEAEEIKYNLGTYLFYAQQSGGNSQYARIVIGEPTTNSSAATKKYVDESIQSAILASWAKAY